MFRNWHSLFSMGSTLNKGKNLSRTRKKSWFTEENRTIAQEERKRRLYAMKSRVLKPQTALVAEINVTTSDLLL